MKRIFGSQNKVRFEEPILISLFERGIVKDSFFSEEAKICFDKIGAIEHCVFKKGVELESHYDDNPQDRTFESNIIWKGLTVLRGSMSIEKNIFHNS